MSSPGEAVGAWQVIALLGVQGAMVVAVAFGLERRVRSLVWQRIIWRAALVALLLLVAGEIAGVRHQLRFPFVSSSATERPLPRTTRFQPIPSAGVSATPLPDSSIQARATRRSLSRPPHPQPMLVLQQLRDGLHLAPEPFFTGPFPWIELAWFLGAAAVLTPAWFARCWLWMHCRRRRRLFDGHLQFRVAATARKLGLRRRVLVFECETLPGPVAFGVLQPSVGLPRGFTTEFTPAQQEVMLAHELAHLASHDPLWQALADITIALLWWHPLAWWTRRRLREVSEEAADHASAQVTGAAGLLAECLLQLASRLVRRPPLGGLAATGAGFRSSLGRRIERLVKHKPEEWSPCSRTAAGIMLAAAPVALAVAAVVCTGWAAPHEKGTDMQHRIRDLWTRSLATAALFTTFAADSGTAAAPASAVPSPAADPPAAAAPAPVTPAASGLDPRVAARYGLTAVAPGATATPAPAEDSPDNTSNFYRMDPRLMERYGLKPGPRSPTAPATTRRSSRGRQEVEAKLNQIVIADVDFQGQSLADILNVLGQDSRKLDPAKQGINFVISNVPEPGVLGTIDPLTGQPIPARPADVATTSIRLRLRDVRLKDILDAMTRVADQPIRYSVEDYGVVFSPASGQSGAFSIGMGGAAESSPVQVRTFQVETNTFAAGLESAFGITLQRHSASSTDGSEPVAATASTPSSRDIQAALRQLFQQLGVNLDAPNKAVFYNALTGVLLVRAAPDELELVQAAVETLGGSMLRRGPAVGSAYPSAPPTPQASAASRTPNF